MSILRPAAIALLTATLSAPAGFARDLGNGFSLSGDIELEYIWFDNPTGNATYGFADTTLSWRSQGGGPVGFGFDLSGLYFVNLAEGGLRESSWWGGLVVTTSFAEVSIGRPRPILDTLSPAPDVGNVRALGLDLGSVTVSSVLGTSVLLSSSSQDVYGISAKATSGGLVYGASVHRIESGGDHVDFIELAASYEAGSSLYYGGMEYVVFGLDDFKRVHLGGRYAADLWTAGAEFTADIPGGHSSYSLKLYGDYEVVSGLRVGAQYLDPDVSQAGPYYYGVSGVYSFGSGGFAKLGYFNTISGPGVEGVSASVGFEF